MENEEKHNDEYLYPLRVDVSAETLKAFYTVLWAELDKLEFDISEGLINQLAFYTELKQAELESRFAFVLQEIKNLKLFVADAMAKINVAYLNRCYENGAKGLTTDRALNEALENWRKVIANEKRTI